MNKAALIIFQKNAVLGKVKTRLAASVGDQEALEVYHWLTTYTHEIVKEVSVDKFLFFSDYIPEHLDENLKGYQFEVQSGGNLGERMKNAFAHLFARGYSSVAIIGTDCPYLTCKELNKAFLNLSEADMVVGPAKDGGYYLLGMSGFFPEVFNEIPWSTSKVLEITLDYADKLKLDYEFLKILSDIDTLEDWEIFKTSNKIIHE
ncbi:TIGR04282 family arsenosugar biosynthesis glycosyltransferase [Algoriphagus sp.]|uniref:TIGR04282 family arsenosugar biosynthesis glycosyltransferase n=1 Tax=Algoriphagus sp. TaxID=1872435 RepID=UPI00391A4443